MGQHHEAEECKPLSEEVGSYLFVPLTVLALAASHVRAKSVDTGTRTNRRKSERE